MEAVASAHFEIVADILYPAICLFGTRFGHLDRHDDPVSAMWQGMGNVEWIAADLDNFGIIEVGRIFFDDGLNKGRIDIVIQLDMKAPL